MNLNRWENLKMSLKFFWQEKIMNHVMEHVLGISLLIGAFLLSSCWGLVVMPALEQSQTLMQQEEALRQRVDVLSKLAARDDYAAYEKQLQQDLRAAEEAISKNTDLNKLSQTIIQLAEQQHLQVSYLHLPEAEGVKRHPRLPVSIYPLRLSVKGEYYALVGFVGKAEEKYHLRGISIEGSKDGIVTAELEILAHGLV